MIHYYSTNRNLHTDKITGFKDLVSFSEALFLGIAPDGGLFMPDKTPSISQNEIESLRDNSYPETAFVILQKFLHGILSESELQSIVEDAYNFDIPIESLNSNTNLVRLDQGPTASFKDFAARFMARIMEKLNKLDQKITILVATSGDTGSAVGRAYFGLENFNVLILYPANEISSAQKKQMDGIGGNVTTISVDGKFDDCQRLVKQAFSDISLKKMNLTSANSINIGRILPQIVYYFYAFAQTSENFNPVIFSVPSGNFGNSLGCEFACRMGLPVKKLILAVNENDEFPRFLKNGEYEIVSPSRACLSNAMNVGNPSNLARYFELYGGTVDRNGIVHKSPDITSMRKNLYSVSVSDKVTKSTIKTTYLENNTILEPHGAVGTAALDHYRNQTDDETPAICFETAHPGKFPEVVEDVLGINVEKPDCLSKNEKQHQCPVEISNSYGELKGVLIGRDS